MKRCFKCSEIKPLSEFYRHKMMADGRLNKCKECARRDVRENRSRKLSYYQKYDRERAKTERRKRQMASARQKMRRRHPEKSSARSMVQRAIMNGVLTPEPCPCGETKVQAHHDDYDLPLEVRWLCLRCHGKEHGWSVTASPSSAAGHDAANEAGR